MTSRCDALVQAANELVENLVPVILVLSRSKKALPYPETGSWWIVRKPEDVESAIDRTLQAHGDCNLAILLGEQYESPVVAVDLDDRAAMERARELGVSSSENVWIQRTGGGKGYQVIYDARDIGGALKRRVRAGGHLLDLLTDGYCLVWPSITVKSYEWVKAHGPSDIRCSELVPPPEPILQLWRAPDGGNKPSTLVPSHIPVGQRNSILTSLAGSMRRRGMGYESIVAALLEENAARCDPPLAEREVKVIARSISRYPPSTGPTSSAPRARARGKLVVTRVRL